MNFYPHHIGDFNNATRHLTRVEQSVYRSAIELYYDTEQPLMNDFERLAKRLLCSSEEEKTALNAILSEFFKLDDPGFTHARCDKEIAKYRANTSNKAKAGIASAKARQQKSTGVEHVLNRCATNQEPLTINQEPLTIIGSKAAKRKSQLPEDFFPNENSVEAFQKTGMNLTVEVGNFKNYHQAKGSVMADWQAAWRTWASNAVKFAKGKSNGYTSARDAEQKRITRELTGYDPDHQQTIRTVTSDVWDKI